MEKAVTNVTTPRRSGRVLGNDPEILLGWGEVPEIRRRNHQPKMPAPLLSGGNNENEHVYDNEENQSVRSGKSRNSNGRSIISKAESWAKREQRKAEIEAEFEKANLELMFKKLQEEQKIEKTLKFRLLDIEEKYEDGIEGDMDHINMKSNEKDDMRNPEDFVDEWLKNSRTGDFNKNGEQSTKENHGKNDNFHSDTRNPSKETDICEKLALILARQTMGKDLPVFNGNPADWPSFITELARSTKECGYSDVQNMYRLRKCLKGDALEMVSYMLDLPENLDMVLDTLEMNFGRPEYIIDVLIEKAKKVQSPSEENLHSLILYSNAVRNLVGTMQTLGSIAHLTNPHLMRELVNKLPTSLMLKWGEELSKNRHKETTLVEFSNWLFGLAEAASFVRHRPFKLEENLENPGQFHKKWDKPKQNTPIPSSDKSTQSCLFCSKNGHCITECRLFQKEDVDKRWAWIKEQKLCFKCIISKHSKNDCKEKNSCGVNNCQFPHHPLLHKPKSDKKENVNHTSEIVVYTQTQKRALLRILPVVLKGPKCEIHTYAMLDSGSTTTLIEEEIANKLGLDGESNPISMNLLAGITNKEPTSQRVSLEIRGATEEECFHLDNVHTKKDLQLTTQTVHVKQLQDHWKHLSQVKLTDLKNAKPTILIGENNPGLIVAREVIEGPKNAPMLSKTKLGWVLHGNVSLVKNRVDEDVIFHVNHFEEELISLHNLVKDTFSTESFGVRVTENKLRSKEDERAEKILSQTTKRINGGWETGLLWKNDDTRFPESKINAMQRLKVMERQMDKDENFAQLYCNKIEEYIEKGYACKLSEEKKSIENSRTYYLPHFGVFNPNKPGKLRLVFDAAAKSNGMSLNDALLKGPDLLKSLVGVLFKFRERKIAFTADIRDMFHRVFIRPEDQFAQQFLWRGMRRSGEPDVLQMCAMTFGATSSPCSAQYVKNTNASEFMDSHSSAAKAIIDNHYVDDYLDSCDTEDEAISLMKDVIEIHSRGNFVIGNWITNSQVLRKEIPEHLKAESTKQLIFDTTDQKTERVLGLHWNPTSDMFSFNLNFKKLNSKIVYENYRPTKREILKIVMSVFDPLGFLASFTVKAKILLQEVWRCELGWDDQITENLNEKWCKWKTKLFTLADFKIPRCYSYDMQYVTSIQLHLFCDASEKAFSAVAYLRIEVNENNIQTTFVTAKTRVSPLRPMSIPRLELQAAVMASRLATTVKAEHKLKIAETFFWTDSKTVLCWLNSDSRKYKPFIAHRVAEIEELTDISNWNWISTKENVADEATRDTDDVEFHEKSRWLTGPPFLLLHKEEWQREDTQTDFSDVCKQDLEMKKEFVAVTTEIVENHYLPTAKRCSTWLKSIRTAAWMIRFIQNKVVNKIKVERVKSTRNSKLWWKKIDFSKIPIPELSIAELERAERWWIRKVQRDSFFEEIQTLKNNKPIEKRSRIFQLSPFIDEDGILRVNSRLVRSQCLKESTKYPIILDKNHYFTKLLIEHYHKQAGHNGHEYVLNEIRQTYWILSLRSAVRHCWATCRVCKNRRVLPLVPEMAPLPKERVTGFLRPFTNVGMDYFGPISITVGRRREKRYGVLFTCLSTRAVHLEIASSLTTDATIMAIRRMIARRGYPNKIMSDNGTNLRGAEKELRISLLELDQSKLIEELTLRRIEWQFSPPLAPAWGGSWERLIRSVKTALKSTLFEQAPKEDVLYTLFVEAESIVNSRPLTFVSMDPNDEEALTPNHFLIGCSNAKSSPGVFTDDDLCLRKRWRIAQKFTDNFWRRWVKEYLPTLTQRTKWIVKTKPLQVGDVVLIADPDLPRNTWPFGKVVRVIPGKDQVIRVADIKTKMGIFRRPLAKLCILDVSEHISEEP